MGRILFLSAVALVAYRYIARSNQRHQAIAAGKGGVEVLPPVPTPTTTGSQTRQIATESDPEQELVAVASSLAAEPEPRR
jgi:hypothetical protein